MVWAHGLVKPQRGCSQYMLSRSQSLTLVVVAAQEAEDLVVAQ